MIGRHASVVTLLENELLESCASHLVRPSPARYRCQECHTWGVGRGVLQGVFCASSCSANPHHRNGFQVPEGHDAVGRIWQYSTLASRTPWNTVVD